MPEFRKKKPAPAVVRDTVFVYISQCCSARAEKPACVIAKGQRVGLELGATPEGEGSLGHFRCSTCRKPCKVNRSNKPKDIPETESPKAQPQEVSQ